MYKKLSKSNISLKKLDNQYYLEKNGVILDKTCPNCGRFVIEEEDFCNCGYYLKGLRIAQFWGILLIIYTLMGVLILAGLANINNVKNFFSNEIRKNDWNVESLAPVNVQLIGSLKSTSYDGYIQSIYVKPDQNNKLQVLIKPSLWNTLSENEKKDLLRQLDKRWSSIYIYNNPYSDKKPIVGFANND